MVNNPMALLGAVFPSLLRREKMRARWGHPGEATVWGAKWYFTLLEQRLGPVAVVDDKTWSDLEFPRFFADIDTTITPIGRQFLFAQLRTYVFDEAEHERRRGAYQFLQANREARENIQLKLVALEGDSSAYIADLLMGPEPARIAHGRWIPLWSLLTVLLVFAALLHLVPVWACGTALLANLVIAMKVDAKLSQNIDGLLALTRLVSVANKVSAIRGTEQLWCLEQLRRESQKRKHLVSRIGVLSAVERLGTHGLIGGLVVAANLFFLLKLALYARSVEWFASTRSAWESTFQLVGALDASIAIANFLVRYPVHCRPKIGEDTVQFDGGYHSFIVNPIKNSVRLKNQSALITGSNMTGKTTFIKMIAMNIVLGHTLGVCLADAAEVPRSPVRALIRGDQSVAEGKSRFFAETEAIRGFIKEAETGTCRIFVIDEPFSGTNTVERVAIAKAVLGAIGRTSQVLVTTHDVELQRLLGDRFDLFHFQENPEVEGFFDHTLHSGASYQRNAIKVLERLGYPAAIIEDAAATVSSTSNPDRSGQAD